MASKVAPKKGTDPNKVDQENRARSTAPTTSVDSSKSVLEGYLEYSSYTTYRGVQ